MSSKLEGVVLQLDGKTCPVCFTKDARISPTGSRVDDVDCPRCGHFLITWEAKSALTPYAAIAPRQRVAASSWLREHPDYKLRETDLPILVAAKFPSVGERAEKLLIAIAQQTHGIIAAKYELQFDGDADWDLQAISWSSGGDELRYLLNEYLAEEKRWLTPIGAGPNSYVISPAGHDYLDSLRRAPIDSEIGFCAMWFDPQTDAVWRDAIWPAISDAGYRPRRIDELEHVNRIDDEILVQIRRCNFVVADFAGQRHGVYFEAGFALGLGRTVIWTVRNDDLKQVHFDNRQYNFVVWKPEELPAFRKALAARIVAVLGQGHAST